jgi:tRNA-specific 2-thiouridylase
MGQTAFAPGERVLAKIRYSHAGDFCRLYPEKDGFKCVFERPQRAITPGQAVVFYRDGAVLGGGTILGDGRFMGAQNGDE